METQKKLGQLLVERGAITGEQLIRAIQSQRALGGRIGTCLLEMDVVTEDHLLEALSQQLSVPAAHIETLRAIDDTILEMVPAKVAVRCLAVPFAASDTEIQIATLNVHNLSVLDELAFCCNRRVRPHIANEVRIFEALEKYYGYECPARFGHLLDRLNRSRYMWDESAKILLGASVPMEWHGLEVLDTQWNEQRRLIRPAASRSTRSASAATQTASPASPPVATVVQPATQQAKPSPQQTNGHLSLADVDRAFADQPDREQIGQIALRFLGQYFQRAALFRVQQGKIRGWMAGGEGIDSWMFQALELSLDEPSLFLNLARGSDLYVGAMPPLPTHQRLVQTWGGEFPRDCLLLPLRIRNRLAVVLYGDCGARGLGEVDIEALRQLEQKASMALELCILKKKLNQL